jgi:hypothetical protein
MRRFPTCSRPLHVFLTRTLDAFDVTRDVRRDPHDPFPVDPGDGRHRRSPAVGPAILAVQSFGLAAAGIAVLSGVGVGSTAMRIGVGLLFLALGAIAGGIGISLAEGQPQAPGAAVVFDAFALGLLVLWLAPVATLIVVPVGVLLAIAIGSRHAPRCALTSRPDGRMELRHGVEPHRA